MAISFQIPNLDLDLHEPMNQPPNSVYQIFYIINFTYGI